MNYNVEQLDLLAKRALDYLGENKRKSLLRYEINITSNTENLISYILNKEYVLYFQFPNNTLYTGYGKSLIIDISSTDNLNNTSSYIEKNFKLFSNIKKDSLQCYGATAFNLKQNSKMPWQGIPRGRFIIPRVLIKVKNKKCSLIITYIIDKIDSKGEILNSIHSEIKTILELKNLSSKNFKKIKFSNEKQSPNKKQYLKMINQALHEIKNSKLEKIVLSKIKKYKISTSLNLFEIIRHMNNSFKDCFNFIYQPY